MVLASKSTTCNGGNEGNWGMGFLLVFFHHNPDEEDPPNNNANNNNNHSLKKRLPSFSLNSPTATTNKALMAKTQSTLSICGLLLFTTLLLFTLSTFEPTTITANGNNHSNSYNRRMLQQVNNNGNSKFAFFGRKMDGKSDKFDRIGGPALQGMGELYRRGSKAMTDLVVGHVAEGASEREIVTFMRLVHHTGLLSRSDLVFIFDSVYSASRLGRVVKAECDSFVRLVNLQRELNGSAPSHAGLTRYLREVVEEDKEAMWGRKVNFTANSVELTRASYGSVVGFEVSELDPEDSLSGFLDHVPMSLRRWACYPMLLGRLRRHFKHTMLVDVRGQLIISDPFGPVRNRTSETVLIRANSDNTELTRHTRRNSVVSPAGRLNAGVILGGSRGVRRFATAALTEIVRAVVEHKGKKGKAGRNPVVTESGLVNQLVHSGHLLKKVNLVTPSESIPEASSLAGFNSLDSVGSGFLAFSDYFTVVQRGHSSSSNNVDIDTIIRREICSSHDLYSSVYKDCLGRQ